jgi:hypothetical protein
MDKETEVLTFLFNSAKQDSNLFYDIKPMAGADTLMLANKLLKKGYIKDEIQGDATTVKCAISLDGIRSIAPSFVEEKTNAFLRSAGDAGTIWNVIDILKEKPEGYQFCFDLANDMQNRNLVKLLYASYPSKVMVEMTLEGVKAQQSEASKES